MKNIKIFAMVAMAATIFASCSKETNTPNNSKEGQLIIKLDGVSPATRAQEGQATTGAGSVTLTAGTSHIFIFGATGEWLYDTQLVDAQAASGDGQKIAPAIPSDALVYVVGNLSTAAASIFGTEPNRAKVLSTVGAMTSFDGTDKYKTAVVANNGGTPVGITKLRDGASDSDPDVYQAAITLNPVISRLELLAVETEEDNDGGIITAFDVTGVFVDSYYPQFTYGAGYAGDIKEINQETDDWGIGDEGEWSAVDVEGTLTAALADSKVWAYNLAAGALPRLIIRLENVKWAPDAAAPTEDVVDYEDVVYYLTVTGYNSGGLTSFAPGSVYRLNGISFDKDDLGLTPNPTDVELYVKVTVGQWTLVTPTADI